VQSREQRRCRAQPLDVVGDLALQEEAGVRSAESQHAQVFQADDEQL
jgi:hypothetical protein